MSCETTAKGNSNPYGDSTDEDEAKPSKRSKKISPEKYGGSTDEDEYKPKKNSPKKISPEKSSKNDDSSDSGLPELPDFFSDKNFFLYGEMSAAERRMLNRYIAAGDGWVEKGHPRVV